MPRPRAYHIRPVLAGETLADAVRILLKNSATPPHRLIATGQVQVNGNVCVDGTRRVRAGDVVHILDEPVATPAVRDRIRIVFRDEHVLVCEKPAGVTSVRGEGSRSRAEKQKTLEELLDAIVAPAAAKPKKIARPVHRLDRDTSGLMVFAMSEAAEKFLSDALKHHRVERLYHAVVHGDPGRARRIETNLVRDRGDGLRGSTTTQSPDAQRAVTNVKTIERLNEYSIVECRLETGRTHQIRIHLAEIGHILCGERTYTRPAPNAPRVIDNSGAPRQALHSTVISFAHPITAKRLKFTSSWPADLASWIEKLRVRCRQ